ncbi:MAG: substrate-binding domain-containing protein [Armatimonadota bacterium]|nr:substrate-binding domain-containing protein [Armatimonadota bacterium]
MVIVMIPKLKGDPYFNACEQGAREAAAKLPNVTLQYDGPTTGNSGQQIALIQSWIVRKPNVIAVSCNDPNELAPVLKQARSKGIHVITWDADANPTSSGREFFVNQAPAKDIGAALVDVMAQQAGPAAQTVVITSTLTSSNQNDWRKAMQDRITEKYPQMKILATMESQEDQAVAVTATQDALKAYPTVKGIFGITSHAFPGAAEAVEQAHMAGKIAVVGLSGPKTMKDFVKRGVVKTVVLWSPVDLGYLTVYTADALAKGTLKAGASSVDAGRLGQKSVVGDQVLLGKMMYFNKDNIDKYDF